MKLWSLLAVLAIACLLPIFAKKSDNNKVTDGSICENELGQCMVKQDAHQCMLPLAKLDCPNGKLCCKTIPKDYEAAGLPLKTSNCEQDPKCTKVGGECISPDEDCEGTKKGSRCRKSPCTCCYLSTDDKINSVIKMLEKLSSEMATNNKGTDEKMTNLTSALKSHNAVLDKLSSEMATNNKGTDEKMTTLASALTSHNAVLDKLSSEMATNNKGTDQKITAVGSALESHNTVLTKLSSDMDKYNKDNHNQLYCALKGYQKAYKGSCYFISSSGETWSNAQKKCVEMGGNLVKIDDDEEFIFLQDQITARTWIGLSDTATEGIYIWVADGSRMSTESPWWYTNNPDNYKNREDCCEFYTKPDPAMLNDVLCTRDYLYFCEMPGLNI